VGGESSCYASLSLTSKLLNLSYKLCDNSQGKVRKFEEETQLQSKGVLVKGFSYLLEAYLGLLLHYSIIVRVSSLSYGYLLFCEISLGERRCTC
jgi:hypothetical protein